MLGVSPSIFAPSHNVSSHKTGGAEISAPLFYENLQLKYIIEPKKE